MSSHTLTPDDELVPDPGNSRDAASLDMDPHAGIPAERLDKMAESVTDPSERWELRRAAARARREPGILTNEGVLQRDPDYQKTGSIAERIDKALARKRAAYARARDLKSKSEELTAMQRANLEAEKEALEIEDELYEMTTRMENRWRVGGKLTPEHIQYVQFLAAAKHTMDNLSLCAWLSDSAVHVPHLYAMYGVPYCKIATSKNNASFQKGWEKHYQAVLDNHPVIDPRALQAHVTDHVRMVRAVTSGLLNRLVKSEDL